VVLISTLVIAVALGTAGALVIRAVLLHRIQAAERLAHVESYGFAEHSIIDPPQSSVRVAIRSLATRIGAKLSGGEQKERALQRLLVSAGVYGVRPNTFLGYKVLAMVLTGGLLAYATLGAGLWPPIAIGMSVYGGYLGWMVPQFLLKSRARRRLNRIELEMPELIDLLVVTVEAGLGLAAALQRSATRMKGPLGKELGITLREYDLGLTIEESLRNFVERCDAPATRALIRAVTQGQTLGIPIGQVMRRLADDLRKRRLQLVQERAQKAPLKILFPLAFLILPTIFIVVLYPALYNVMKTLGS
jgi:tight adherence protein C